MSDLAKKQCVPCKGGVPPLTPGEIQPLLAQVTGWEVINDHHLQKTYEVNDFAQALDFANRIGTAAESQQHHPDLFISWGKARVQWWSHKIDGLTESDFIMAAKCDLIFKGMTAAKARSS